MKSQHTTETITTNPLPKFAITTINVEEVANEDGHDLVEFDSNIKSRSRPETEAVFLMNIQQVATTQDTKCWCDGGQVNVYRAVRVDAATFVSEVRKEAAKQGKKGVLLYIHGYTVGPDLCFSRVALYSQNHGGQALCIPILWPTQRMGLLPYITDRKFAVPNSSFSLNTMLDRLYELHEENQQVLPISIMCHSMGNYALRRLAEEHVGRQRRGSRRDNKPLFEHVFAVAADVDYDIFYKHPKLSLLERLEPHPGMSIAELAKGKVHVFYSTRDLMVGWIRRVANWGVVALGGRVPEPENIHPSLQDKVVFVDCTKGHEPDPVDEVVMHCYQFAAKSCEYYDKTMFG